MKTGLLLFLSLASGAIPDAAVAFVLRYRLPGEGWGHRADVPLQDAQRAMRLIRARVGLQRPL